MPDPDPPRAFADELRSALADAARKQSWLGAETARIEGLDTPIAQPQISKYLRGESTPDPARVFSSSAIRSWLHFMATEMIVAGEGRADDYRRTGDHDHRGANHHRSPHDNGSPHDHGAARGPPADLR